MKIDKVDKAIREEQILYDIAKDRYEKLGIKNCLRRMEEHKQYIELFEELKELREENETLKALYDDARKEGNNLLKHERNKAIDDFAEKMKYEYGSDEIHETIDEIAEQLKEGRENE